MSRPSLRIVVPLAVLLVLATVLAWWLLRGDDDGDDGPVARLERSGDVKALEAEALQGQPDRAIHAVQALGRMGPKALPSIRRAMAAPEPKVRAAAVTAFSRVARHDDASDAARLARQDESPRVRAAACRALGSMVACREVDALVEALDDGSEDVRRHAYAAFQRIACITIDYRADDPPGKRRAALDVLHAVWPRYRPRVIEYWEIIGKRREGKP